MAAVHRSESFGHPMEQESTYFNNGDTDLGSMAEKNPEYTKIYMNVSKDNGVTTITLSKDRGDILYILSSTSNEKYSDYFRPRTAVKEDIDSARKGDEGTNAPKRVKQSTLLNFMKR